VAKQVESEYQEKENKNSNGKQGSSNKSSRKKTQGVLPFRKKDHEEPDEDQKLNEKSGKRSSNSDFKRSLNEIFMRGFDRSYYKNENDYKARKRFLGNHVLG
jgi:hypothetical protein